MKRLKNFSINNPNIKNVRAVQIAEKLRKVIGGSHNVRINAGIETHT